MQAMGARAKQATFSCLFFGDEAKLRGQWQVKCKNSVIIRMKKAPAQAGAKVQEHISLVFAHLGMLTYARLERSS